MDQYEVLEQIGRGVFGTVHLVRHKREKKMYVLKKIRLARQTDKARRSAHQEMELMAMMQNPFIVEYKDSWVEKGCYVCIIIAYCEGGDMEGAIKKANGMLFSEEILCKWLVQLLMALDYLHLNHILHRDVKCSNIFLTKGQDIRLGDFGFAKMLASDDLASSVVGTPIYMCPEIFADIPYGSKSDIWSLGCSIYEMTSHKAAFKAFDMKGLIHKINKPMVAPVPAKYSRDFRGLVKSMLRRDPELRPSAAELLRHQHLQPYVLKVNLELNSPMCSTLSTQCPESDYKKKPTFSEPDHLRPKSRDRRLSYGNDRMERLSINNTCEGSPVAVSKTITSKPSKPAKNLRFSTPKTSSAPKKRTELSKGRERGQDSDSKTSAKQSGPTSRLASLPLTKKPIMEDCTNFRDCINTVKAPRIDRMVKFPLNEHHYVPTRRASITSAKGSSYSSQCDRSIMKDNCIVQACDTDTTSRKQNSNSPTVWNGSGSNCSDQIANAGASSRTSSDMQAEALERLLDFCARLLLEEKFEELGVMLKPFGPGRYLHGKLLFGQLQAQRNQFLCL